MSNKMKVVYSEEIDDLFNDGIIVAKEDYKIESFFGLIIYTGVYLKFSDSVFVGVRSRITGLQINKYWFDEEKKELCVLLYNLNRIDMHILKGMPIFDLYYTYKIDGVYIKEVN